MCLTPRDDARMSRNPLGAEDEDQFHERKDRHGHDGMEESRGAKQWRPHGEVVATEGQGHREGGQRASAKDLARHLVAVAPRVDGQGPWGQTENSDPGQWNRREESSDRRRRSRGA